MRAISYTKAFAAFLGGGGLVKTQTSQGKTTYEVYEKDSSSQTRKRIIGHITEKQFGEFMGEGILEPLNWGPAIKDKYGTYYIHYVLPQFAERDQIGEDVP